MLSCREVTTLVATDALNQARPMTRLGVRLHLMMCRHCRRYVRELARLGSAVRALYDDATQGANREALVRGAVASIQENATE